MYVDNDYRTTLLKTKHHAGLKMQIGYENSPQQMQLLCPCSFRSVKVKINLNMVLQERQ